jgi:hypothetical protein
MAKIKMQKGWVIGQIIDNKFFVIDTVTFPINDDGRVLIGKERFIVYDLDFEKEAS